jgi:hypothetical protein
MDFLNDLNWVLFSKVSILISFFWIDIFFLVACIIKSFLDGHIFIWTLLID